MARSEFHSARVAPAEEPLDPDIQEAIDTIMRGRPPLTLFTTLARDPRLFSKFFHAGLLDRGHLTIRQREIVIDRVTAACRAEYEWGVHVAIYADRAELTHEQIRSLTVGGPTDDCWTEEERLLLLLCDELQASATISQGLWDRLGQAFSPEAIIELVMLAGQHRTISYLVNGLDLAHEPGSARFEDYED